MSPSALQSLILFIIRKSSPTWRALKIRRTHISSVVTWSPVQFRSCQSIVVFFHGLGLSFIFLGITTTTQILVALKMSTTSWWPLLGRNLINRLKRNLIIQPLVEVKSALHLPPSTLGFMQSFANCHVFSQLKHFIFDQSTLLPPMSFVDPEESYLLFTFLLSLQNITFLSPLAIQAIISCIFASSELSFSSSSKESSVTDVTSVTDTWFMIWFLGSSAYMLFFFLS